jgi:hypothetical protein
MARQGYKLGLVVAKVKDEPRQRRQAATAQIVFPNMHQQRLFKTKQTG